MSPHHQWDGAQQTTRWPPTHCHLSHNGTRQTAFSHLLLLSCSSWRHLMRMHGRAATGTAPEQEGGWACLWGGASGHSSPTLIPGSPRAQPPWTARLERDSNLLLSPQSGFGRDTPRALGRCWPHLHSERAESRVSAPCPHRVLGSCLAPAMHPLLPCRPCRPLQVSRWAGRSRGIPSPVSARRGARQRRWHWPAADERVGQPIPTLLPTSAAREHE